MKYPKITFFNFSDSVYANYFVAGLLQNQRQYDYRFCVSRSVPDLLRDLQLDEKWLGYLPQTFLFKYEDSSKEYYFCIDGHDPSGSIGYHLPLLESVEYFFKVNYNQREILTDPRLEPYADKIAPIGPMFPIRTPSLWHSWPRLSPAPELDWTTRKSLNRLRRMNSIPSLNEQRSYRHVLKDLDVFFVIAHYNTAHDEAHQFRYEVIRRLHECQELNLAVGFVHNRSLPPEYAPYSVRQGRFSLREYLRNLARSKVAIYVRGPYDCISFKFSQLMVMGKPIIGQTLHNNRAFMYSNPYFDEQFAFDVPAELVANVRALVHDSERQSRLAQANADTFDTKLAPGPVVANMLERLGFPARLESAASLGDGAGSIDSSRYRESVSIEHSNPLTG